MAEKRLDITLGAKGGDQVRREFDTATRSVDRFANKLASHKPGGLANAIKSLKGMGERSGLLGDAGLLSMMRGGGPAALAVAAAQAMASSMSFLGNLSNELRDGDLGFWRTTGDQLAKTSGELPVFGQLGKSIHDGSRDFLAGIALWSGANQKFVRDWVEAPDSVLKRDQKRADQLDAIAKATAKVFADAKLNGLTGEARAKAELQMAHAGRQEEMAAMLRRVGNLPPEDRAHQAGVLKEAMAANDRMLQDELKKVRAVDNGRGPGTAATLESRFGQGYANAAREENVTYRIWERMAESGTTQSRTLDKIYNVLVELKQGDGTGLAPARLAR